MATLIKHNDAYMEAWDHDTHWIVIAFSPDTWAVARTTYHDPGTNAECSYIAKMEVFTSVAGAEPPIYFKG